MCKYVCIFSLPLESSDESLSISLHHFSDAVCLALIGLAVALRFNRLYCKASTIPRFDQIVIWFELDKQPQIGLKLRLFNLY